MREAKDREHPSIPIAAFRSINRADEYAGACQQDFKDNGLDDLYQFSTQLITYYDE